MMNDSFGANNHTSLNRPEAGTIIPLSEGAFTIDKTKLFVPFNEQQDNLQERPVGSLLVEIQPFLVFTENDILLLDTGLGFHDQAGSKMQLHGNLEKAGVRPEQVTKVLQSHLHKDHAGGLSMENDRSKLSLPNATYYIQKRELEFALMKGLPSFIPEELVALSNHPQVQLLDSDEGIIDNGISFQVTGAHSPYHQAFWIQTAGKTIFFGGDVAPQLQQMKIRYKTKYDFDPDKALQLRRMWWEQGHNEGWTFLFYHDIKTPVAKP